MEQVAEVFARAHRKNIQRYRRLLRTHLTELERSYVERRLAEEKAALLRLTFHPDPRSPSKDPTDPALGSKRISPASSARRLTRPLPTKASSERPRHRSHHQMAIHAAINMQTANAMAKSSSFTTLMMGMVARRAGSVARIVGAFAT
jgi:hypothetical protein